MSFTLQSVLIPTAGGYDTVDVQIIGDRITAIATQLEPLGTLVNGRHHLLLPGFVNAHTHSSELWQRGMISPLPLELWLAELYDFALLDPEQIYLSAVTTAIETLQSGGTTVVDHLVLIPGQELETVAAAVRGYQDVGIRAFVGPLIQDQAMTQGIPSGAADWRHAPYSLSTQAVLDMMVAPTGIQMCSDALFEGVSELSDRASLCRHAHLLETRAQQMLAQEKYGHSAVQHLQNLGFLSDRTSLAHCVWLDEPDIQILAETGSTVVHNPLSNLRLGSGTAPILKYRQAGVNVAFGCDGSASNDAQDLLEVIKIGSILHHPTDPDYQHWITPREAVEMAALGGAKGLKLDAQLGSLQVGKTADLVLYDLTQLSLLPRTDPIGLLVLGRPTNTVSHAWVNGKLIIADHQVITVDVNQLRQQLFDRSQWQRSRQSPTLASVEAHYRSVMGLSALPPS
jgi:cytosine/adenosine deaminase-related metal-dependent hydrolase